MEALPSDDSDFAQALRARLEATYQRVHAMLRAAMYSSPPTWDNSDLIGGAMAILVRTAYHLGEIRQALCTLR